LRAPDDVKKAVLYMIKAGFQVHPGALEALKDVQEELDLLEVAKNVVEKARASGEAFIRREHVEEIVEALSGPRKEEIPSPGVWGKGEKPARARDVEADIEVLMDPTVEMGSTGRLDDLVEYFRDRFKRLSAILKRRMDARDAIAISRALRAAPGSEVKLIGMVHAKKEREGKILIVLEDEEAKATILFTPKASASAYEAAKKLMLDQVICVRAVKMSKDMFLAKDVMSPDVPVRGGENRPSSGQEPVYAVLISDIHYGSVGFVEEAFRRFLAWLKGSLGNERLREIAGAVKYVVVAGDLVDGVGVYPGQEAELVIADVYRQYEGVASLLAEIPDHIELILSPGNHDACRRALPQPAIPKAYAEPLYSDGRAHVLGNPCLVALHGVKFLIYHGNSFDDMVSVVPGLSFDRPLEMMKLMLKARHLAPIYGMKTPIAPAGRDMLVIEEVPDVFHTGHVHVTATGTYRGVLLVNSGAWQAETAYQRARGIVPTPGRAVLVDLRTLGLVELDFTRPELWA